MGPSGLIYKHPLRERYVLLVLLRAGKVTVQRKEPTEGTTVLLCLCHKPLRDNFLSVYLLICKMERLICWDPLAHDVMIIGGYWKDDSDLASWTLDAVSCLGRDYPNTTSSSCPWSGVEKKNAIWVLDLQGGPVSYACACLIATRPLKLPQC